MSDPGPKGRIQIAIGIVVGILLLLNPGTGLLGVHAERSITQNEALLSELGRDPADFQHPAGYWIGRFAFHAFGFAAILLYIIFVASKKLRGAQIGFLLCLGYFLIAVYSDITGLSEEQQMRGYTIGGWIGRIVVRVPKLIIELALLVQGVLGTRKQLRL